MSGQLVTRAEMVDAMSAQYNAQMEEARGADWRRVNASVLSQTDNEIHGDSLDFHLFELCLDGCHTVEIEGDMEHGTRVSTKMLSASMAYVQPHSPVRQTVTGKAKLLQIYIDDIVFQEVADAIAPGDPTNLVPLGFQGVFEPQLKQLGNALLHEARTGALGGELCADLLAQQIALSILRRRLNGREKKRGVHRLSDREISSVIEFMEANLEDTGGLEALASSIGMDVCAFTRAFKATTGEAPHQFLIERRLTRVKDLLVRSRMPLAEVAYATGFSSQSHMTATFTKHVGLPPGQFRRAAKS